MAREVFRSSLLALALATIRTAAIGGRHRTNLSVSDGHTQTLDDWAMANMKVGAIPDWKVNLALHENLHWWTSIYTALWGSTLPAITSTPAQDSQKCPILKLPADVTMVATSHSWTRLRGEITTPSYVALASWEQSFMGMSWWRDLSSMPINFVSVARDKTAVTSKQYTDKEMYALYRWKAANSSTTNSSLDGPKYQANLNLALLDCAGYLMFVVRLMKDQPYNVLVYGRDGRLVTKALSSYQYYRYQWIDPDSGYLLATAESPAPGANISRKDMQRAADLGNVLPLGIHFEQGGYANSSALMEPDYRWVIAVAMEAIFVHDADATLYPWTTITILTICWILLIVAVAISIGTAMTCIFRCIYPSVSDMEKLVHGRIAENPFLAVPACPPHRDEYAAEAQRRQMVEYYSDVIPPTSKHYSQAV